MDIKKVIKTYFIFVMAVATIGVASYNDTMSGLMTSVLHAGGEQDDPDSFSASSIAKDIAEKARGGEKVRYYYDGDNEEFVSFEISGDSEKRFVAPGTEGAQAMTLDLKALNETVELNYLRIKIYGVDDEMIKGMRIKEAEDSAEAEEGDEVVEEVKEVYLAEGNRDGEYFIFRNIDYKVLAGEKGRLTLVVDLSEELKTGKRIRFDIENPEDLELKVNGERYEIPSYYPIQGEYLSIGKPRAKKQAQ